MNTAKMDLFQITNPISDGYSQFLRQRGLPQKCAYELISEDFYDDYERLVITKFIELFEAIDSEAKS